jgi:hypothetical protein
MSSIPAHHPLCQAQPEEPPAALIEQFYAQAKREIVTGDYLRRKWEPLCGPRFYALIKAIRGYCSYKVKEGEAMCYPSEEKLAQACGVTRRTIINWLVRVRPGEEEQFPDYEVGDFCHRRHGKALQQFLRIAPQRRYVPAAHCSYKAEHHYFICMDDPPVPEDIPLIRARARELAIAHLERQQEEQEREARRQECEARAARATFGPGNCTHNNVQNFPPQQWEKIAQDRLFSPPLFTTDSRRSAQEEERAVQALQSTRASDIHQASGTRDEEDARCATPVSKSNGATALGAEDGFRRTAPLDEEEARRREEREQALEAAYEAAGGVVYALLEEWGDTNAAGGTRNVLSSLVAAGAPPVQMVDLAYLARDRVRAFVLRGGRILDTPVGFYITTLANLAKEARRKGWNLEQIAATDRRRHERALHRGAQRQPGQSAPQPQPRLTRPAQRKPSPAEVETLVIELGQQEETYAQAQEQVRQVQEQRHAREARQQAIRQQADLFMQLDQAQQALKQHPEGSSAWERARREEQEIERRIAALRQPAPETPLPTAPPGQHAARPARSERDEREAIHAWARARGWTVKHGQYGGSQRDWQIGLMALSRQELADLAAALGV